MKFADINKKFSDTVARYMADGYTIFTPTMAGSQGEIASIDLTRDNRVLRVLLERVTEYKGEILEGIKICAGFAPNSADRFEINGWDTIWNNRLEVIHEPQTETVAVLT